MAKFGSFLRRLFTSLVSDESDDVPIYSPRQSRKSIVIISPSTPPPAPVTRKPPPARSCSTSPRFAYRTVTKQSTIHMEPHHSPYPYGAIQVRRYQFFGSSKEKRVCLSKLCSMMGCSVICTLTNRTFLFISSSLYRGGEVTHDQQKHFSELIT